MLLLCTILPRCWEGWHCICRQRRRSAVPKGSCQCHYQHGKCSLRDQQFSWLSSWVDSQKLSCWVPSWGCRSSRLLIVLWTFYFDMIILIMIMKIYEAVVCTLLWGEMIALGFVQICSSISEIRLHAHAPQHNTHICMRTLHTHTCTCAWAHTLHCIHVYTLYIYIYAQTNICCFSQEYVNYHMMILTQSKIHRTHSESEGTVAEN